MNRLSKLLRYPDWHLPGQRILKTGAAVTLCLFFYMLRGYKGEAMPAEAAITAIICMQPHVHGTTENGLNRLAGTVIGAVWGFLFLLLMMAFPAIGRMRLLLYLLMGVGTLISLHSAVLIRMADASGLAAIVFICVVIAYPDIENPLDQAFHRILWVLLGAGIAIGINAITLPRIKQRDKVFFVPAASLTNDLFTQLSPSVLFYLDSLLQDGAKICLMSRHAPAFHTTQFSQMKYTVPMIVMDGAAIFDANENVYISTTGLNPGSCRWLIKRLEGLDVSFFIYTVHRDRNCIYHRGPMTEHEDKVYRQLKRSPYRYYLDDDHFSMNDVVYIKIVTTREAARHLQRELEPSLEKMKLRSVIRPQAGTEDAYSLYFYAINATIPQAQAHLMRLLRQKAPALVAREIGVKNPGQSEHDAVRLMRKLRREYEPGLITALLQKKN